MPSGALSDHTEDSSSHVQSHATLPADSEVTSALPSTDLSPSPGRVKVKRNRLVLSCQPCHKRKQQCDRGHPCQRCVKRGTTSTCIYDQPRYHKKSKAHHVDPPNKPESVSSRALSHSEDSVIFTSGDAEETVAGLDDLVDALQAKRSVEPAIANHTGVELAAAALGQLSQSGPFNSSSFANSVDPIVDVLTGLGRAVPVLSDNQSCLPNHRITAFLINYYFEKSSFHWLWPIHHRPCFENYYRIFSNGPLAPSLEFVALLSITCAVTLQFLPETDEDVTIFADYEGGRHVLQQRLHEFAGSVLQSCGETLLSSIERVQAMAMFSLYEWTAGHAGTSYYMATMAIRMAQTLAMNRDGTTTWAMRPHDAECRRRFWWLLFVLDRWQSNAFRRPYVIMEQHVDAALPMNLDQADLHDFPEPVAKPMDEPTDLTFHILHAQLAKFMGRQWDLCFGTTLPTYRNVLDLEEILRKFELDIPSSLRYQTAQSASARPYLSFQNHMLTFEVFGLRVLLLSPFMFVHPPKESDMDEFSEAQRKQAVFHKHAKSVCLAYAKRQLACLQMYETQVAPAHLAWPGIAMVAFGSAMVLAISMIIDPRNSENDQLAEWIIIAEDLLKGLLPINRLALTALRHLEIIRRRSDLVLCMIGRGQPCTGSKTASPQTMELSQRLQRAAVILSQPVPCMTDLLGHVSASDPFWSTWRTGLYAGHFPGIESLSGGVDPQELENFLDNCVSMQSRMPPTIAV